MDQATRQLLAQLQRHVFDAFEEGEIPASEVECLVELQLVLLLFSEAVLTHGFNPPAGEVGWRSVVVEELHRRGHNLQLRPVQNGGAVVLEIVHHQGGIGTVLLEVASATLGSMRLADALEAYADLNWRRSVVVASENAADGTGFGIYFLETGSDRRTLWCSLIAAIRRWEK